MYYYGVLYDDLCVIFVCCILVKVVEVSDFELYLWLWFVFCIVVVLVGFVIGMVVLVKLCCRFIMWMLCVLWGSCGGMVFIGGLEIMVWY